MRKILYHGTFLTMDEEYPAPEAVLVSDGRIGAAVRSGSGGQGETKGTIEADARIGAVGTLEELKNLAPEAELWDMEGRTVLPGFIDGHSHLTAAAYQLLIANLKPSPLGHCDSVEDVVRELRSFLDAHPVAEGGWLLGMGYDNSVFPGGVHPTKEDLDRVSREVPIAATHVSGHLCVVNTKGLELLGYSGENYSVPEGGVVEPTGLLKEQAFLNVNDRMQGPSPEAVVKAVGEASHMYASYGITTVHDGKVQNGQYELLKAASGLGLLCNDVVAYLVPELAEELLPKQDPADNPYDGHVRMAGVKLFLDGSPQGKTAWLSAPYYEVPEGESPDYCGFPVQTEESVLDTMKTCIRNHWQINVHANGDAAIEQMIRCYEKALKDTGSREDLRPVVIHCQTVREDQLDRMKAIGMIASFFHDHVYYWGDYHYESVLGPDRASRISPLQSALKRGISFTLHQDTPVAPPDVMAAIHNAVNRRTLQGRVLGADQAISVEEALKAVTVNGAFQIFEEADKGSITPGKKADFVVLGENPLETPKERLKQIRVLETIKDGETIYCV